ncbi:MAG: META domain-containing protein [Alistipes sp.]|nr:META domain-containing protein [Alistipes sp.]
MKIRTILALFCAVLLVGCCSQCRQRQKNAKPLVGTTWHLVQFEGRDVQLPQQSFNLRFGADGSISGTAACNQILGQYSTTEKLGLHLDPVGTTMMLCPENGELEIKFTQLLGSVTHYDIDFDTLLLIQDGTIKALLRAVE